MSNLLASRSRTLNSFSNVKNSEWVTSCTIPVSLLDGKNIPKEYVSCDGDPVIFTDIWKIKIHTGVNYFIGEASITSEQFYQSIKDCMKQISAHDFKIKNQSFFVTPWGKEIIGCSEKGFNNKVQNLLLKDLDKISSYLLVQADLPTHTISTKKSKEDKILLLPKYERKNSIPYLVDDDDEIEWGLTERIETNSKTGGYSGSNFYIGKSYTPKPPTKTYQFMKINCKDKNSLEVLDIEKENVPEIENKSNLLYLLYGVD